MTAFHLHGVCTACTERWDATTIHSTISLTNAERVPDGPTDIFPCPVCLGDVEYEVRPGEADLDDDGEMCHACGWKP